MDAVRPINENKDCHLVVGEGTSDHHSRIITMAGNHHDNCLLLLFLTIPTTKMTTGDDKEDDEIFHLGLQSDVDADKYELWWWQNTMVGGVNTTSFQPLTNTVTA